MSESIPFRRLSHFIQIEMRMSHVYQPVMLRALLSHAGQSSVREIAKALLSEDQSQIEYFEQITKRMVKESGVETPTIDDLVRLDRARQGKKLSNED
jgi:mevalonate kinase